MTCFCCCCCCLSSHLNVNIRSLRRGFVVCIYSVPVFVVICCPTPPSPSFDSSFLHYRDTMPVTSIFVLDRCAYCLSFYRPFSLCSASSSVFILFFFPCSFHSLCVDYWVRKIIYETRTDGFLLNSKRFIVSVAHIRIATNQSLVHERSTRLHTIYFFFRIYTREMLSRGFAAVWRRLLLDLCVDASIGRWWFVAINIIGHWCRVTCNS